jgi:Cadherin-like
VEGSQSFKRNHVLYVMVRENLAAPWVDVNTGLQVPFSSSIQVTANQLSALDLDSEAKELHFKVFISSLVESHGSLSKG